MPSSIAALIAAVSCASFHRVANCFGALPSLFCMVYITSISSSPSNSGSPVASSDSKHAHAHMSTYLTIVVMKASRRAMHTQDGTHQYTYGDAAQEINYMLALKAMTRQQTAAASYTSIVY
jgi:hypothetical protein